MNTVHDLFIQISDAPKDVLIAEQYNNVIDECDMESKKMILPRIMSSVRVSRDYEIEITITMRFEQFGGLAQLGSVDADGMKMSLKNAS